MTMKTIVMDLDNTITIDSNESYENKRVNEPVKQALHEYREKGFKIVISSSRQMRTYKGNLGKINANTLPVMLNWLDDNDIPYDEVYVGKPWCGFEGFYVDDKAIRPSEFVALSYDEIQELLEKESKLATLDGES